MLTYVQRLVDERDHLTQSMTDLGSKAAERNQDLTETEQATLSSMQSRCAEIDRQLDTYGKQAESMRAYAQLRSAITSAEDKAAEDAAKAAEKRAEKRSAQVVERRDGNSAVQAADTSWAAPFMRSGVLQSYTGHGTSGKVDIGPAYEVRATGAGNGIGTAITTDMIDGITPPMRWTGNATPTWTPRLLNLASVVPTTLGAVDWIRYEPHPPSEAQIVAEGDLKPEATITLAQKSATLDTVAHWKAITRQALEDIVGVQAEVENRLRAGILLKLQNLIADALNGDPDIPTVSGPDLLAAIRMAMGEMDDSMGYVPSGVALNPADWASIDLALLGATLNGALVNGGAWGITFTASNNIPAGTAYVGDFSAAVTLFQRNATSVYLTDSHSDFFLRNTLVILAETRAFAAITEPMALVKATGPAPTPPPPSG